MIIAIAQTASVRGDIARNLENHRKWIQQAILHKAELVVFPELSLTGYEPDLAAQLATNQEDTRLEQLQQLSDANGITVCVGLPTREGEQLFVSMLIFQPHKVPTTYSKQYLYPPEKSVFTEGIKPLLLSYGTELISPAICYEASVGAHSEYASQNNATLYMASVLSSVGGIDAELTKLSCIAKQKRMVTCMANYVGISGGYQCAGKSSVWNEQGELMGQLGDREEGLLIFDTITREIISTATHQDKR